MKERKKNERKKVRKRERRKEERKKERKKRNLKFVTIGIRNSRILKASCNAHELFTSILSFRIVSNQPLQNYSLSISDIVNEFGPWLAGLLAYN